MKITFVGGGALRLLGTLRGAMARPGLLEGGEICLYDLNVSRAEALGRMLMKSPEYRALDDCTVRWPETLEDAVEGADYVGIVLRAGSPRAFHMSREISQRHGYMHTDNISPNGAFLGMKGAPIMFNVARTMEKLAPQGWLVDFANPVAVHSALVNRYTKIRAMGVCEGYTNHLMDLSRLLGRDVLDEDWDVEVAGVNHLSYIVGGSYKGEDIFTVVDRAIAEAKPVQWQDWWKEEQVANMTNSVKFLRRMWQDLGVLVFSTEGDGMAHLRYDEVAGDSTAVNTAGKLEQSLARDAAGRADADREFQAKLGDDLGDEWWSAQTEWNNVFARNDHSIFTRTAIGIGGNEPVKIATSRFNDGAVAGLADDLVLEYSQIMEAGEIRPAGTYRVPQVVYGITAGIANYQTMLADGLGQEDPQMVARALLAYPIRPFHESARAYFREMAAFHRDELPEWLRGIGECF